MQSENEPCSVSGMIWKRQVSVLQAPAHLETPGRAVRTCFRLRIAQHVLPSRKVTETRGRAWGVGQRALCVHFGELGGWVQCAGDRWETQRERRGPKSTEEGLQSRMGSRAS